MCRRNGGTILSKVIKRGFRAHFAFEHFPKRRKQKREKTIQNEHLAVGGKIDAVFF